MKNLIHWIRYELIEYAETILVAVFMGAMIYLLLNAPTSI